MALDSMQEIFEKMQEGQKPFWKVVQDTDVEERQVTPEASFEKMRMTWKAMLETVDTYRGDLRSLSGLVGGDGQRMAEFAASGKALAGDYLSQVITLALCTAESNACMRKIVAAPTAGACGVLPAVLLPCARHFSLSREQLVQALYVASGFGMVIAARASISGAEGGCQAEIGSAAAMAAPALVHLRGGTPSMMAHACAMAVKNLLGLVCDPVGGLVEVPCVKRNVIGAMDALSAAQMALAGIESRVPPDQVLEAMAEVGRSLPPSLRETGKGGLAATPFGMAYAPKEG